MKWRRKLEGEHDYQISLIPPLLDQFTTDLSPIFREPTGARKERHCQVSCVSDGILSIIGKSRLSLTFLPKTIMAPNCHFGDKDVSMNRMKLKLSGLLWTGLGYRISSGGVRGMQG